MIVNLWSTPRTGSVRYSYELKNSYDNSILITEMFNKHHMKIYHLFEDNRVININEYAEGCFYKDYLIENNKLIVKKLYQPRVRNVDEEESYLIDLLDKISPEQMIIMHNHVAPINESIRERLVKLAKENIYIYRKNKREQLASYAIAYSTKQFASFKKEEISTSTVNDIDSKILENLIRRIIVWDNLPKYGKVIAYEDITFKEVEGLPYKQNFNHYNRLSDNIIKTIERLVEKYENNIFE